jgi:hypothetical protein
VSTISYRNARKVQVLGRGVRIMPYSFDDTVKEADRSSYSWGVGASHSEDSDVESPNELRIGRVVETVVRLRPGCWKADRVAEVEMVGLLSIPFDCCR